MGLKLPVVHITFLDHCIGPASDAAPITCDVFGLLVKTDRLAYYVAHWVCNGQLDDFNTEISTILKTTVLKKKILK